MTKITTTGKPAKRKRGRPTRYGFATIRKRESREYEAPTRQDRDRIRQACHAWARTVDRQFRTAWIDGVLIVRRDA